MPNIHVNIHVEYSRLVYIVTASTKCLVYFNRWVKPTYIYDITPIFSLKPVILLCFYCILHVLHLLLHIDLLKSFSIFLIHNVFLFFFFFFNVTFILIPYKRPCIPSLSRLVLYSLDCSVLSPNLFALAPQGQYCAFNFF